MKRCRRSHLLTQFPLLLVALLLLLTCASPAFTVAGALVSYQQHLLNLQNKIPDLNSGYRTTLYLRNPGSSAASLNLAFTNPSTGAIVSTHAETLNPLAVLEKPLASYPDLPAGAYNLAISSDVPIECLARIDHANGDQLAIAPGIVDSTTLFDTQGSLSRLFFGPFFRNSKLILANFSSNAAVLTLGIFDPFGMPIQSADAAISAGGTYIFSNEQTLPSGVFFAAVSSDMPLYGYLMNADNGRTDFEIQPPLAPSGTVATLPRAIKSTDEGGGVRSTRLYIANVSTTSALVNLTYTNGNSSYAHSGITIPSYGFSYVNLAGETNLPASGIWAVTANSNQSIVLGEITSLDNTPYSTSNASYAGISSGLTLDLPYLVHKSQDFSVFSVQNISSQNADLTISYYNLAGALVHTQSVSVTPAAAARINLDAVAPLGNNFVGSAVITSNMPIKATVDVFTPACSPPSNVVISRNATGDIFAGDSVTFSAAADGDAPFDYAWTFNGDAAGSNAAAYDKGFSAPGNHTLGVTLSNACGQSSGSLLVAVKPLTVTLTHSSTGTIFSGDTVHFTAATASQSLFSFAWTLDGTPVGSDSSTYDANINTPGSHSIAVVLSNSYAQASASLQISVVPHLPDLSTSTKSVDLATFISNTEILSYTITLKNSGEVTANASLSDPIPGATALVANSPVASDGGPLTVSNGILHWAGPIGPAAQVIISYQVTVLPSIQIGDKVINTAAIQDGAGGSLSLEAQSTYNPGFSLSIQDGAAYTHLNPVMLTYTWDASKEITHLRLSNDGGFGLNGNTTAWLPVDKAHPNYANWMFAVLPYTVTSRTVYIQFKDAANHLYGPYQDDIIFDAVPPQINTIEILPGSSLLSAPQATNVIIRVSAKDDRSNVALIVVSDDLRFTTKSEFTAVGEVTDIPWLLSASGNVYVRVYDGAGNSSIIHDQKGAINQFFLPLLTH